MVWATRPGGKTVPLDPAAVTFIVTEKEGKIQASTLSEFQNYVKKIVLTDGREIEPSAIMAICVTHFATCPAANHFSASKKFKG